MENEQAKVKWYKQKKVVFPAMFLMFAGIVGAVIIVASIISVNLTILEPISATSTPISVSGIYPNAPTNVGSIAITNNASVAEPAYIIWTANPIMTAIEYDVLVSVGGGANTSISLSNLTAVIPITGSNVDAYVVYTGTNPADTIIGEIAVKGTLD